MAWMSGAMPSCSQACCVRVAFVWDEITDFRNGIRYEIRQGDTRMREILKFLDDANARATTVAGARSFWLVIRKPSPIASNSTPTPATSVVPEETVGRRRGWPAVRVRRVVCTSAAGCATGNLD